MADRRHKARSRGPPPSPRRPPSRSRDFSPPKHRKYSPYGGPGRERLSRDAGASRRIEKKDRFDRGLSRRAPKISEYDNRDRDYYMAGDRRYRSPPRIRSPLRIRSPGRIKEKGDEFDRDNNTSQNLRLPSYEDAGKGKYRDGINYGRSMRSYEGDSYKWDHLLDGPRKTDHFSVKDYGQSHDYSGVGDSNNITNSGQRDYFSRSRYLDSGRDGLSSVPQYLDSTKAVPPNYGREETTHSRPYTLRHGGVDDIPVSKLSGANGSSLMPSVVSCHLNSDTDKRGYAHVRDEFKLEKREGSLLDQEDRHFEKKSDFHYQDGFLGTEKRAGDETCSFKNEDNLVPSRSYFKGDSDYMVSSSHPKNYVPVSSSILRDGFPSYSLTRDHSSMPSHLSQRGGGLVSQPTGFDGYKEKMENMLPRGPGGQLEDTGSASRLYMGLPKENQGEQLFGEFGRSKVGSMSTRLNDVEEDYRDQHLSRNDVFNPAVDECFYRKPKRDDGQWDPYLFSQQQSMPNGILDASRSLHARKQELDMLGTGSSRLNYGYGSFEKEGHYTGVDGGQWSHVERSDFIQSRGYDFDPSFGRFYDSPRKTSGLVDLSFDEPFERRLRNEHVRDDVFYEQDVGIRISADGNGVRKIYNRENLGDEIEFSEFSKRPKSSKANYDETWRGLGHMANDRPTSSKFRPSRSDSRNIKKRLGPVPRKLHVSQRLVKKYKPSIKKRLAPAPPKKHASLPWIKNLSSNVTASVQNSDGSPHDHEGDHLEDLPLAKSEPPEKSEDFKQLVQGAFFKFLKQINETPTKRKKYLEQGKAGSLKCIVCGSNSKEFVDTESLAKHAFTSKKVGLRSQHFGLHKALCALMGWKITDQLSSEWRREVMSNTVASALKEDLIIWPPVVIIYNSTIDNKNPDQRVIVSTEKLDMMLREMGFGSIVKVCIGKPANQSVTLVKFNGTLSGLQEAERYHNRYLQAKHGRAALKQLKSENEVMTQVISAEREEDFLYGHLGIAEDIDKLDFDTKKRCVLRSKKEILSIANAN